jgi:non-ribosomal peptide synthetase component F
VSLMIFLDERSRLYEGREVPPLRYQYRHFVEQSLLPAPDLENRCEYWRRHLPAAGSRFSFPTDYSANPPALLSGEVLRFRSSIAESKIKEICRAASATPFMLYLAAYAIVLTQTGGSEGVIFGSSLARVDLKPDENIIGYSLDMLLMPVRVRRNQTLTDIIAGVRDSVLAAQQNVLPFTVLADALNPDFANERPWPGMNLYDAWVRGRVFEFAEEDSIPFGDSTISLYSMTEGYLERGLTDARQTDAYARCYLPALYLDDAHGASGYLEYNRAVFLPATAARISSRMGAILEQMAAPATSVEHAWTSLRKSEASTLAAK